MALVPPRPPDRVHSVMHVHPKTAQFPLAHAFVHSRDTCPFSSWLLVRNSDFFDFLCTSDCTRLCPLFCRRTAVAKELKPICEYITVSKDVSTQSGTRLYKYAEGLVNVELTAKGATLRDDLCVLTVERTCHKGCAAVGWTERVTVANIKDGFLQVRFSSLAPSHSVVCVPDCAASKRTKPLIAQHVAIKQISRVQQVRLMDVESNVLPFDLSASMSPALLKQARAVPPSMARDAFRNTRRVGREDSGDFEVIDRLINAALDRNLSTVQRPYTQVVPVGNIDQLRVIEYHPAVDPSCHDVNNPNSWYWVLIKFPNDQEDMAAHARASGLYYDAKIKLILDGGLVMPFCAANPTLPTMPGVGTPAHGLLKQHVTVPNYILLANTEKAEVITKVTTTIRDFQRCAEPGCDHACELHFDSVGGYTITRTACAQHARPGTWKHEVFDAASPPPPPLTSPPSLPAPCTTYYAHVTGPLLIRSS